MSSKSPAAPKKSGFRKLLGNLKDGFRSSSSSRPASPHLKDTSASTVDLRPPPIALSRSPSLVAITQPVSLVTSIIGAPATVPSSVDDIPAVTVTEPSAQSASISKPSTGNKLKQAGNTAWIVLKLALDALEKSSDAFPPLKSAVAAFNACLSIVENAAANRSDYENIANELGTMVNTVGEYAKEFAEEDKNGSIRNIISSMEAAAERIRKKQERGKIEQMAMSKQDKDDVMECYRQIEISFRRLQTLTGLWTARKMDRHHEQKLLQDMSPEEDARYNSGYGEKIKRRSCTADTRERIQRDLQNWACDSKDANIYWMNGMAGTGKTTIAFSLCKWLESNKQLGGSFFCSRAKDSCRDPSRIIPTIACQLGRYSPHFRSELCKVLDVDSGVTKLNVVQQFQQLIKGPLEKVEHEMPEGVVVVIDALDECQESDTVRLIFQTLIQFSASSPVKFFVASRPEYAIRTTVQQPISYSPATCRLQDIEGWIVADDIEKYLIEAFSLKSLAPSDDEIKQLVKIADKLFIYAATVVRHVVPDQSLPVDSSERLKEILANPQLRDTSESSEEYKDLDALYSTILEAALSRGLKKKERERIERVLWTVICAKEPMSITTLASLLDLSEDQVLVTLSPLHSVLDISSGDRVVSTLHASFPDYMLDNGRSKGFACNAMEHSDILAHSCFVLMKKQLRFNICNLKSSLAFDSDIADFSGLINRFISSALFYACQYWSAHLQPSNMSTELTAELDEFISDRLLFWMEVLNVNRCIVTGAGILRQAQDCLQVQESPSSTRNLVADARSFVTRFAAGACKRSTPHIYTSALPFCPKESLIYKQYWGRTKGLVGAEGTAINGLAQAAISTWMTSSAVMSVAISSDGRHIVSGSNDKTIRVWDAQTGQLVAGSLQGHTSWVNSVGFSPDGKHIVSGSNDQTIRVWDAQTGQLVAGPLQGHTSSVNSVGFSPDGKHIVSGSNDQTIRVWDAQTGHLVAGPLQGHTSWVNSVGFSPDGKHIVSGSNDQTIRVWDAQTGHLVAGPLQGHSSWVNSVGFSPDGKHIVSGSDDATIRVWDAQTGQLVAGPLQGHTSSVKSVGFSPDGKHIVSGSNDQTIRVWDAQTSEPVAGPLQGHTGLVKSVGFSPDGKHIVSGSDDNTIRVWDAQTGQPVTGSLQGHTGCVKSVGFSPDGKHIASSSAGSGIQILHSITGVSNLDVTPTQPDQNISAHPHYWAFEDDGWITLNDQPYLWISPHIRACFPSPLHPLAIGPQGSIYIDSWNLLIGDSWSKCYISQ